MTERQRKLLQAALYETGAVLLVTPIIILIFNHDLMSSFWLSVAMSTIAMLWNYAFNTLFEAWEKRQTTKGRSWQKRVAHAIGFEGGLAVFFVPLVAYWLSVSWWVALVTDVGLLLLFLLYTVAFTWLFDCVFGLPASAR